MKLQLDEIPTDLQPLARLINRFHAMNTLERRRVEKGLLSQLQEKILADLEPMQSTHPVLTKVYNAIKDRRPEVIAWMKPANDLRELLLLALRQKEAAGEWFAAEVDLRLHQADDKPVG